MAPAAFLGAQQTDGRHSSETKGDGTETYGGHDLKNLSVFLNVKKGRSQPGNKGLCFVCDCNSGECQRTNAHTATAAGVARRRHSGGTGWCLGTRSKNSRILNTLLLPQFSSDSTSHGCRRADANSPPPPRRLSTSVQSNKLNSSRARNASSSTSRMLQT